MSVADELRKLADLKKEGLLTEEEFEAQRAALLGLNDGLGPSTRQPRSAAGTIFRVLLGAAVVVGLLILLGQCSGYGRVAQIKADDRVLVGKYGYGCEMASRLEAAARHRQKDEITAWAKIISSPGCFSAHSLPGDIFWTVLSVEGNAVKIEPELSLARYEEQPEYRGLAGREYWTFLEWLEKAE